MDLKIKDVADLLNISETTVLRWLADEKIPSYRINGQYLFNRSEIEDWLMQQKLGFGEQETKAEEKAAGGMHFSLYRAIHRGEVLSNASGTTKEEVIASTMRHMSPSYDLDPTVLTELFLDRERMMPTALGEGIAVPHTRDFLLDTHFDVIMTVFPKEPLPYGALDGQPVSTLFFLFACEDRRHLHLLAKIAHLCQSPEARALLTTRPSKEALLEFIKGWESTLNI